MAVASAEVAAAVAQAHRTEWAFVLAAAVRVAGDLDLAEEAVQDAYAAALSTWGETGIPANPGAWLTTTARRRVLDAHRRAETARRAMPLLVGITGEEPPEPDEPDYADDRLRLIFTCCHPALEPQTRIALTLKFVCGLSTAETARALLVQETAMAARLTRAKQKIARARIPYAVPTSRELPERLDAVLDVVHLVYSAGHTASAGTMLERRDLAARGLDLAELLHHLLPREPEAAGLLALLLLTEARRDARLDPEGAVVLLAEQDRGRWDRSAIRRGLSLLSANTLRTPGRFTLMAAVAAVHDQAESWETTDWTQIVTIYDELAALWPSPVVALNRAIAIGFADGPEAGLDALMPLTEEPQLARYPYLAAARASFLERLGRWAEAVACYDEAILLSGNDVERADLERRRATLAVP